MVNGSAPPARRWFLRPLVVCACFGSASACARILELRDLEPSGAPTAADTSDAAEGDETTPEAGRACAACGSSECVDLDNDRDHCGSCSTVCASTACVGGACRPELFVEARDPGLTVMTATDAVVVWASQGGGLSPVSVPTIARQSTDGTGHAAVPFEDAPDASRVTPSGLAVADGWIYATANRGVFRLRDDLGASKPSLIYPPKSDTMPAECSFPIVVPDRGELVFARADVQAARPRELLRMPFGADAGMQATAIGKPGPQIWGLVYDGDGDLFYANANGLGFADVDSGSGSDFPTYPQGPVTPDSLAHARDLAFCDPDQSLEGGAVIWHDDHNVYACEVSNGDLPAIDESHCLWMIAGSVATTIDVVAGDGSGLYWVQRDADGLSTVYTCRQPFDCSRTQSVVGADRVTYLAMALNSTHVYAIGIPSGSSMEKNIYRFAKLPAPP
jgi:hypothetical protein